MITKISGSGRDNVERETESDFMRLHSTLHGMIDYASHYETTRIELGGVV